MKYLLSVCAIFKNEGHIIEEWIEHHLREGIEHFYLVNNESTDDYLEKIQKYIENGVVSLFNVKDMLNIPGRQQIYSYNKIVLPRAKKETEWLAVIDLDEFMYARELNKTVRYYVSLVSNDVPAIYIPWLRFGSSGLEKQPKSVIKNFLYRKQYNDSSSGKSILRVSMVKKIGIHFSKLVNRNKCLNYNLIMNYKKLIGKSKRILLNENIINTMKIACNHYQIQSKDFFFAIKATRGAADSAENHNIRNEEYFKEYDTNDILDDTLMKKYINNYK